MSKVRNISGGPLDVPLLDRTGIVRVEDGEVLEVPDFQPAHNPESVPGDPDHYPVTWPGDKWEPVPEPKVPAEKKRSAAAGKGGA